MPPYDGWDKLICLGITHPICVRRTIILETRVSQHMSVVAMISQNSNFAGTHQMFLENRQDWVGLLVIRVSD